DIKMDPSRRTILKGAAGLAMSAVSATAQETEFIIHNNRVRQSVCQWCYGSMSIDDLARNAARIGLKGIDLVGPEHFATLKKHNLVGTMTPTHPITKGVNRK